jgi:hypothetical protein
MDSKGNQAPRHRELRWAVTLVALSLGLLSCAGDEAAITTTTTTSTPTTTTTVPTTTTTTLPGESIDLFPEAGDILAVVGVSFDSELNVRAAPGTDQEVLARLAPLTDDVVATGQERQLPDSIWYEITTTDEVTGWASSAYLAWIGETSDVTAAVIEQLGETPAAETMLGLGLTVALSQSSEEPESRIRVAKSPTVRDLGEVTYDVIGLGDDAVFGLRLTVFGTPDETGDGFTLKSVESTALCARGITAEGLCP